MQERVTLSLAPTFVSLNAGGTPASVVVSLTNRSNVVDQFGVTVEGAGADWYDVTPDNVSLFPGETGKVTVNLHPPRRENVHSGDYQLVLRDTARDDPSATAAAAMIMRITPTGGFQFQLLKARDVGQEGAFSLRAANLSDAPLMVNLAAYDPETALTFYFPAPNLYLQPYEQQDMFFNVRSSRRPMKGEAIRTLFTVEADRKFDDPVEVGPGHAARQGELSPAKVPSTTLGEPAQDSHRTIGLVAAGAALRRCWLPPASSSKRNRHHCRLFADMPATRDEASRSDGNSASIVALTPTTTATPTQTPTPNPDADADHTRRRRKPPRLNLTATAPTTATPPTRNAAPPTRTPAAHRRGHPPKRRKIKRAMNIADCWTG